MVDKTVDETTEIMDDIMMTVENLVILARFSTGRRHRNLPFQLQSKIAIWKRRVYNRPCGQFGWAL